MITLAVSTVRTKNTTVYNKVLPLPETTSDHLSKIEFAKWRKKVNMPIVLRGFLNNSIACQTWSIEWLTERFGDQMVQCIPPNLSSLLGEEVQPPRIWAISAFGK